MLSNSGLLAYQSGQNDLVMFKKQYNDKLEQFNNDNKELIDRINKLSTELESDKEELISEALDDFRVTGSKQLLGGLGIRVSSKLSYDEDKAFNWAKEHGLCLKLDVKSFEKLAKIQQINFVMVDEIITVTFPKEIKIDDGELIGGFINE